MTYEKINTEFQLVIYVFMVMMNFRLPEENTWK